MKVRFGLLFAASFALATSALYVHAQEQTSTECGDTQSLCYQPLMSRQLSAVDTVTLPKIATPAWLAAKISSAAPVTRTVTYTVATKGQITADLAEFKSTAAAVYRSSLGWSRLGVSFDEVAEGGDFTLWLAQDSSVPSFASNTCDAASSCTVGKDVVINQTRWLGTDDAWRTAGMTRDEYRTMELNHGLGHWLGHGHRVCSVSDEPAPVMRQPADSSGKCTPNPWPVAAELYAPQLGIRS